MSSITKAMMMSKDLTSNFSNIPLTFEALEENTIISIQKSGSPIVSGLQYRIGENNNWNDYIIGTEITLSNIGDIVQFQNTSTTLSTSMNNFVYFTISKLVNSSGNIQSLLNYSKSTNNYCFYRLFKNCNTLKTAPELPATTLANYCYSSMFYYCTRLTQAPELPVTTLANCCYFRMFQGCTNLIQAPELPATTLTSNCYTEMFNNCTSLTTAPELPATTLDVECYAGMFQGCTNLTQAPELPATTLAYNCYGYMFYDCTSLSNITVYFNNWSSSIYATDGWLTSVNNSGTFICSRSLSEERGTSRIPENWSMEYFD